jgi:adenylate cyclase
MSQGPLKIAIVDLAAPGALPWECEVDGPVEFGRQEKHEPAPLHRAWTDGGERIIIAPLTELAVPRHWFRVATAQGEDRVQVKNLTDATRGLPLRIPGYPQIDGGKAHVVDLPFQLNTGRYRIRLGPAPDEEEVEGLPDRTMAPSLSLSQAAPSRATNLVEAVQDPAKMVPWLQTVLGMLQSAVTTNDFYQLAAKALVDVTGMDSGRVLLFVGGEWKLVAEEATSKTESWTPSTSLLSRVVREKRTFRHSPSCNVSGASSLKNVSMAVVSPILDTRGEPIGALYAERRFSAMRVISELDAKVVELLAWTVASGVARIEEEKRSLRNQAMMEQFFTPRLAVHLERNPDLLKGRRCDITVLFADVRRFSTICHNVGPDKTMDLVNAIMTALSECVFAEDGVVVNFIGDELLAMWGAPTDQEDHAMRASRAAIKMLERLPKLNDDWRSTVAEKIDIGIGINSGSARVGNIGSATKFQYGPLGSVVNLASRVQGVTKFFRSRVLVTESTRAMLAEPFATRRLGQVRVVNIPEPATLHELVIAPSTGWMELSIRYEKALAAYEASDFARAAGILGELVSTEEHRDDGPSLILMQRTAKHLIEPPESFSPVLELSSK